MTDEDYMRWAVLLAKNGRGKVNPNPLVGAIIVKDGRILAEGYHAKYGELHAERMAFSNLENPEDARGADLYVTMEPCCHHGKQPPCTDAIIEHGIKRVIIGSDDPNHLVCGKGIEILKDAGIEVVTGVLKDECDKLNQIFFHYITKRTPYVLMKYAMTLDGKIATAKGHSKWISGEKSRERVHETRNELMAIMVGIGTVLNDDPLLNCRMEGGRNPIRIVCDTKLRIPLSSQIIETACKDEDGNEGIRTIIATTRPHPEYERYWNEQKETLEKCGVEVLVCEEAEKDKDIEFSYGLDGKPVPCEYDNLEAFIDLNDLMLKLGEMEIDSVLLEGGSALNFSALKAGIVNRLEVYVAPKIFGGTGFYTPVGGEGVDFPDDAFKCKFKEVTRIGDDMLMIFDIEKGRE